MTQTTPSPGSSGALLSASWALSSAAGWAWVGLLLVVACRSEGGNLGEADAPFARASEPAAVVAENATPSGPGAAPPATPEAQLERFEFDAPKLGTRFRLVFFAPDLARAKAAAAAAFRRIDALDAILSDYDPTSELSRLSALSRDGAPTAQVPVSAELFQVLACAQELAALTDGAFDVTVGPFVRLWRRAKRQQQLPTPEQLATARAAVGYAKMRLDPEARTVTLLAADMRLDLGGIAKGFILDEALAVLEQHGIHRALLDGGGDLVASGPPPGREAWRVLVVVQVSPARGTSAEGDALPPLDVDQAVGASPAMDAVAASDIPSHRMAPTETQGNPTTRTLQLVHGAVATSGDTFQFVELDGRRYAHLIDPATGLGLTTSASATVWVQAGAAGTTHPAMLADAWASALTVLGAERGLAKIEALPGVEARVATPGQERQSPGF